MTRVFAQSNDFQIMLHTLLPFGNGQLLELQEWVLYIFLGRKNRQKIECLKDETDSAGPQ